MIPVGTLLGAVAPQGAEAPTSGLKPEEGDFVSTLLAALGRVDEVAGQPSPAALGSRPDDTAVTRDGAAESSDLSVDFVGSARPVDGATVSGPNEPDMAAASSGSAESSSAAPAPPFGSHPATASAAPPAAPSRTTPADRDPSRIAPELQQRIDRIVERMQTEFGHRVELVEGYRAPERQAQLFAQGRTAPGPVVTWTTKSAHSDGRAADLMVDGGYEDPVAYARLQQIAREEGLRTLGMQDRGHVELAGDRGVARDVAVGTSTTESESPALRRVALGVARVARVASRAQVAQVARPGAPVFVAPPSAGSTTGSPIDFAPGVPGLPATPAPIPVPRLDLDPRFGFDTPIDRVADAGKPGNPSLGTEVLDGKPFGNPSVEIEVSDGKPLGTSTSNAAVPLIVPSAAVEVEATRLAPQLDRAAPSTQNGPEGVAAVGGGATRARTEAEAGSRDGEGRRERETTRLASPDKANASSLSAAEARAAALEILARGTGGSLGGVRPVGEMGSAGTLQSLERVLQAQELARSAPTGRVTVRLDGTAGAVDTVRVGLNGQDVSANLDVSDAATSRLLRSRVGELHDALGKRGMDLGPLGIRTAGGSEAVLESLLGNRTDSNTELLRALLSGNSGNTGENGRDREGPSRERSNYRMNDDRSGSDRSGRDARKEEGQ